MNRYYASLERLRCAAEQYLDTEHRDAARDAELRRNLGEATMEAAGLLHRLKSEMEPWMTFSKALEHLRNGARVSRKGWNGKNMFVELQVPDEHSKMRRPYLFMSPVDGELVPWVASQSDILSDDWQIVE